MEFSGLLGVLILFCTISGHAIGQISDPFQQHFYVLYGQDHAQLLNGNKEIQLSLDQSTGSGFGSLKHFVSGIFQMRIKLAKKDTSCTITSFYLTSSSNEHDELDFEFYGCEGQPHILQTNVFTSNVGNREQKVALWFDPTANFHTYEILWNQHQVGFFVDGTPIRVFKNNTNLGVGYPWQPMQVTATIWFANWSCSQHQADWSQAPFVASYQGFGIQACPSDYPIDQGCYSSNYFWNLPTYWTLDPTLKGEYENARAKYLVYDYCADRSRYPQAPLECVPNEDV